MLRQCRTRCWHCRIFFLTDPRNAERGKLGCPFGCAQAHRKQESNRRSLAHNRSKEGRKKKSALNNKRRKPGPPVVLMAPITPSLLTVPAAPPVAVPEKKETLVWPKPVLDYVRRVVSWIEGRLVSLREVWAMLAKVLRQHSMARRRRIDQTLDWLNEHPP